MPTGVDIDEAVNEIAGIINAQYGALIDLVNELRADPRLWQGEGVWTMEKYLTWRLGCSAATASAIVTIAKRADDLPTCLAAFRDGRLTLDQMATIARKAPYWTDEQSCRFGTAMTVAQLRHVMGKYPFPELDEDGREIRDTPPTATGSESEAEDSGNAADSVRMETETSRSAVEQPSPSGAASADQFVRFFTGDDGVFRLHAQLDEETGLLVSNALHEARDRLFLESGPDDVSWVDALRTVSEQSLDAVVSQSRRSRFKVAMFIEADGSMTTANGRSVPDSLRQFISCDGTVTPVLTENGLPVSVGRAQHIVPDRTRTLIERRDHNECRVPGCSSTLGLEVHHVIHWEYDGATDTWNLVLICAAHHRMHHQGRLGITGNADDPDGLRFTTASGREIRPSGAEPKPPGAPPSPSPCRFEHPYGERLDKKSIYFNPPEAHRRELMERCQARGGTATDFIESFRAQQPSAQQPPI